MISATHHGIYYVGDDKVIHFCGNSAEEAIIRLGNLLWVDQSQPFLTTTRANLDIKLFRVPFIIYIILKNILLTTS